MPKNKTMDVRKTRLGVEIEVEYPNIQLSERLIKNHTVLNGWEVTYDFSLNSGGAEYRALNKNKLYWNKSLQDQLKEILAIIRCHKGKVNKRTGLHIHIDITNRTDDEILAIIKKFAKEQNKIVKQFKVYSNRIAEACHLLPVEKILEIKSVEVKKYRNTSNKHNYYSYNPYFREKYYALNSGHISKDDYQTLEFRFFNGTLNMKQLTKAIWWCLNFVKDGAKEAK